MFCFGYSGQRCLAEVNFDRSKKVTWIMMNDYKRVLAHKTWIGAIDTDRFNDFMFEEGFEYFGRFPDEIHSIFTFDGLKVHNSEKFRKLAEVKGTFLLNLAPYLPRTNLTEPHIHIVKRKMMCASEPRPSNTAELFAAIGAAIVSINESNIDWSNYLIEQGYQTVLQRAGFNS